MPKNDVNSYLEHLIDQRLEAALAPHLAALRRIYTLVGYRRGPGRPPKTLGKLAMSLGGQRGKRPARRAKASRGDASKFHEGQQVQYRQGRGQFAAKVIKVDTAANMVTVQRESDGKKVVRPPSKLYA